MRDFLYEKNRKKLYFTGYGASPIHLGMNISDEEFTEIFTIFLYDEKYYKEYLQMLKSDSKLKKEKHIVTLTSFEVQQLDDAIRKIHDYIASVDVKDIPEDNNPLVGSIIR